MVQGMAFLSKKGFNPQNNTNRKQVWEAQQHSKQEKDRLRKRQQQLKREQEDAELELATKGEIGGSQAQLRFMYDAPPGLETSNKNDHCNVDANSNDDRPGKVDNKDDDNDLARVKPGDDAAAVAFRQMLAAATSSGDHEGNTASHDDDEMGGEDHTNTKSFKFTPSLQGSMVEADSRYNKSGDGRTDDANKKSNALQDSRSALEKEVGRKNRSSQNNLSYEQQIERFPQLKNAPMAVKRGTTSTDGDEAGISAPMMVHFKPLGSQILHVRCLACGVWGHARGDRECKKSGWNPFALPSSTSTAASTATATEKGRQHPDATTSTASSILPSNRGDSLDKNGSSKSRKYQGSTSLSEHRRRHHRHRGRYDSDSDNSDRRQRRRQRRGESDDGSNYDSSRIRDRRCNKHRRHRYKEHNNKGNNISHINSDPSSEDSSKLKRRNDDRYDSSSEDDRRRRRDNREQSRKRHRDREPSQKRRRSKRYESSSYKKMKKKRSYSSP